MGKYVLGRHHQMKTIILLTVIFIALKLTGQIDWNWFWTLWPVTVPAMAISIITMIVCILALFISHNSPDNRA